MLEIDFAERQKHIKGPCGECGEADACCYFVSLTTMEERVMSHWVNQAKEKGLPYKVVEIVKGTAWLVTFPEQCAGYNSDKWGGSCDWMGTDWESGDCGPGGYPLNPDGEPEPRKECPFWREFVARPRNQIIYDEETGCLARV